MRQVWAKADLLFGIDKHDDPYLVDFYLLLSGEDYELDLYIDGGSIPWHDTEGVENLDNGQHYVGNLTIFQDDENGRDTFRFSSIRKVVLTYV